MISCGGRSLGAQVAQKEKVINVPPAWLLIPQWKACRTNVLAPNLRNNLGRMKFLLLRAQTDTKVHKIPECTELSNVVFDC